MLAKIMKWGFIPMSLLALYWPSPVGYAILLGFVVCMAAIWTIQTSRTGKYFGEAGYATVPCKVKNEN